MDKEYYKEYYKIEREHWWFKVRNKLIINHSISLFRDHEDTRGPAGGSDRRVRILNIGAATGRTTELLNELGDVTTVEYDSSCCDFLKETLNINAIRGSITELPFDDNSFDLVCAFDVIEHVKQDDLAVREMKRVCAPNGKLCITVPAFMVLWSHHDVVNHHYRRYILKKLKRLFTAEKDGKILYSSYFNFLLFPLIFMLRILSRVLPKDNERKGSGSDFTILKNSPLNKIFYHIFNLESVLLKNKIPLPFGVSILLSWEKA